MIKPFHLSFVVPDIQVIKAFYTGVFGCNIGRDTGSWFDIIFYGHQITIHQENDHSKAYTIDHFGPVLSKNDWEAAIGQCESNNIDFLMKPTFRNEGKEDESGKFLIKDPAGNTLEFKFYNIFATTVAKENV